MRLLYSAGIHIANFLIKIIARFNTKLMLGVRGRAQTLKSLKISIGPNDKTLWFHCASLGEYEQGLPVFEGLKALYPNHKIVLSFFSPSGYEIKKNTPIADTVVYLPMDTPNNAKRFLDLLHPEIIVFVKYEIWPNYLNEIKKRELKAILIAALFRKSQPFFKWYGGLMRNALRAFEHVFVQDKSSMLLLETMNYKNVSISGDTRFDRVSGQCNTDNKIPFLETFIGSKKCIVFGSTWPEDDRLFLPFINNYRGDIKFVIAPHNIKPQYVKSMTSQLEKPSISFSEMEGQSLERYQVFILDTIGYLSKAYSYGHIAYVGGAAGLTGLHNILEPAVFGIPIIIGKNHSKFPEAQQMIDNGGVFSVSSADELSKILSDLVNDASFRTTTGHLNAEFIKNNTGAVIQILDFLRI